MGILNINAIETYRQNNKVSAHTTEAGLYLVGILNINAIETYRQHNPVSAHTTEAGIYHVGIPNIHVIEMFIDNIIKHLLTPLGQDFVLWESRIFMLLRFL